MFDLSGKVAIVTGASRGLGRQDALTLAQAGADVVITDILVEDDPDLQKSAEELGSALAQYATSQGWVHTNQTAEEVRNMGRRSLAIKMDVTNREQVRAVFKKVKDEFGRIDILVNNAATLDNAAQIQNMSYELWDRDIKVNLTGAFNCTKEVWPYMIEQKWGRVIFMASVAGTMGGFGQASYSASKMAVIALQHHSQRDSAGHHRHRGLQHGQPRHERADHEAHSLQAPGRAEGHLARDRVPLLGRGELHHGHRARGGRRHPSVHVLGERWGTAST